jgi:hypothetical protein
MGEYLNNNKKKIDTPRGAEGICHFSLPQYLRNPKKSNTVYQSWNY